MRDELGLWTGRGHQCARYMLEASEELERMTGGEVWVMMKLRKDFARGGIMLGVRQEEGKKGMWCVCTMDVKDAWRTLRVTGNC